MLIAVEGIDGSGKTTLALGLSEYFNAHYERPILKIDGPVIKELADNQFSDQNLIHLKQLESIQKKNKEIATLLAKGDSVVCDRYIYSTFAYQRPFLKKKQQKEIKPNLEEYNILKPDAVFILIAYDEEKRRKRIKKGIFDLYEDWLEKDNILRSDIISNFEKSSQNDKSITLLDSTLYTKEQILELAISKIKDFKKENKFSNNYLKNIDYLY